MANMYMRTENIFVPGAASEIRVRSRASKAGLTSPPPPPHALPPSCSFSTDRSKTVTLLKFFFVRRWFHMWRLLLSLFVP